MLKVGLGNVEVNITQAQAGAIFNNLLASPNVMLMCTVFVVVLAFSVCAFGLKRGVERITKPMMLMLFGLLIFLAARSFHVYLFRVFLMTLMPNFENMQIVVF